MEANAAATADKDSTGKNKRKRRSANNAKEPPQVCAIIHEGLKIWPPCT